VFRSALRRCLFATACLLSFLSAANVARADEADDLAGAIVAHIRERWPAVAPPTAADENRVTAFARYILSRFYYPASPGDLKAAALSAVDSTDAPTNASVLVQAAMAAIVNSLGHGARLLTTLGGSVSAEEGTSAAPSSRQLGSLRLVALPTMNVSDANTVHACSDFVRYFDGQSGDGVTGYVLDLRGNEGGPLTDSSCVAGLFLKSGQQLFQVVNKQGELVKYQSESKGHKPIGLPLAVLIDSHTDSGGLLVAAVLQDHRRATVIGEQKAGVNGAVSSLLFPPGANRAVVLPTGEILLPDKRPLAAGVHVDIPVPAHDDQALLNAAQTYPAQQR
jgi:hypothetical protein